MSTRWTGVDMSTSRTGLDMPMHEVEWGEHVRMTCATSRGGRPPSPLPLPPPLVKTSAVESIAVTEAAASVVFLAVEIYTH